MSAPTFFDNDSRLEYTLEQAKASGMAPCGCRWTLIKQVGAHLAAAQAGEDAPYAQVTSVCILHRRFIQALFRDAQRGPDTTRGQLPMVGPVYQPTRVVGEIQKVETAAASRQQGGMHQMIGPLHQQTMQPEVGPDQIKRAVAKVHGDIPAGSELATILGYHPLEEQR